ncbi:MAG: hypothetical protein HN350_11015 [Phycisphaerales bacterium]|jgi:hypothetical protein|nr:hypothetical protein [Phycisphaerales bacterium]
MTKRIIAFSIAVDVKEPFDHDYTVAVSQVEERIEDAVKRECAASESVEYCHRNFYEPDELDRCQECSTLITTNYRDFSTPGVDWASELDGRLLCDQCYCHRMPPREAVSLETCFDGLSEHMCLQWDRFELEMGVQFLSTVAGFEGRLDPEISPDLTITMRVCRLPLGAVLEKICSQLGLAWTVVVENGKAADIFVGSETGVAGVEANDQHTAGKIRCYRKGMRRVLAEHDERSPT